MRASWKNVVVIEPQGSVSDFAPAPAQTREASQQRASSVPEPRSKGAVFFPRAAEAKRRTKISSGAPIFPKGVAPLTQGVRPNPKCGDTPSNRRHPLPKDAHTFAKLGRSFSFSARAFWNHRHQFAKGVRTYCLGTRTFSNGVRTFPIGARTFSFPSRTFLKGLRTFCLGARTFSKGAHTFSFRSRTDQKRVRAFCFPGHTFSKGARTFPKGVPAFSPTRAEESVVSA